MLAIILIVCIFLYLGFEHSIANMGTFAIALFAHNEFTALEAAHNLLWATLGNIVGGGGFIGALYWFLEAKSNHH
jgi:nitrite transporter NirC